MGYMIEISEHKKHKLEEHIESALHEMGKAMACVEQFGGEYGHRDRYDKDDYGMRGRMGYRDEDDWDEDDMGERRRRSRRTGRYM